MIVLPLTTLESCTRHDYHVITRVKASEGIVTSIVKSVIQQGYQAMDDFTSNDSSGLTIAASDEANGLVNLLRKIMDGRKMPTNPDKELLNLSIGN